MYLKDGNDLVSTMSTKSNDELMQNMPAANRMKPRHEKILVDSAVLTCADLGAGSGRSNQRAPITVEDNSRQVRLFANVTLPRRKKFGANKRELVRVQNLNRSELPNDTTSEVSDGMPILEWVLTKIKEPECRRSRVEAALSIQMGALDNKGLPDVATSSNIGGRLERDLPAMSEGGPMKANLCDDVRLLTCAMPRADVGILSHEAPFNDVLVSV